MSDATIWAAMGATAACTSALTGLFIHVANGVSEARRRPEADWLVQLWAWELEPDPYSPDEFIPGMIAFRGEVMNCGDAKAFSVVTKPSSGQLRMSTPLSRPSQIGQTSQYHDVIPLVEPGAQFHFRGTMPIEDWPAASIVIDWITSPTRLKKHLQLETRCADQVPNPGKLHDE